MSELSETGIPPGARRVRLGNAPLISVVVASEGPRHRLEAVLDAVREACVGLGVEIVVARAAGEEELASLRAAHPTVRFVGARAGESIEALRVAGMEAANGDVVRILEDGRPLPPGWAAPLAGRRVLAAGEAPAATPVRD